MFMLLSYPLKNRNFTSCAGLSKNAPPRDYSLESSKSARVFSAFTSISIIAAIFGNGILPEIQVISTLLQNTLLSECSPVYRLAAFLEV